MTQAAQGSGASTDDRLVLLRVPDDTFVPLAAWGPQPAMPTGPVMLRVQHQLARRGLARRLRFASAGHALVIRGCDEERAMDVVDVALSLGLTTVDLAAREVVHPLRLGQRRAIADAFQALRETDDSYLIVEGGPDLAFYVQAIHLDREIVVEAVAREHVRRLPGVRLPRLRLLGFELPDTPRGNATQKATTDGAGLARVVTRALCDAYALPEGAPVRLRTNGL